MTQRKRLTIRYTLPLILFSVTAFGNPVEKEATNQPAQAQFRDTVFFPAAYDTAFTPSTPLAPQAPQVTLNKQASQFVSSYLKKEDDALQKIKKRSHPYFKIIENVFKQHELPLQLKYLAVVESELKRSAVSHMGAAGPWQLMPVTARELGLKITSKTDERTHYYKSTTAAAKYLKRLYTIFDDWLLVIAAYNSGPGTVLKAIKKTGSRNFWHLQYHLPAETRMHVKRFIGVHYFFEGEGSETVLTRRECEKFKIKLQAYEEAKAGFEEAHWTQISVPQHKDLTEANLKLLLPAK
jgi:membrane-bound lytic murein transglycosylase D